MVTTPTPPRFVGARLRRTEDPRFLTGRGYYVKAYEGVETRRRAGENLTEQKKKYTMFYCIKIHLREQLIQKLL